MRLHADFSERVVIRPEAHQWVPSPAPGVERMMLDRVGDEVARATSLVRYAPGSTFPEHEHGGGEEFLVLDGAFGDEHGLYPRGTYVRNPIGTRHSPRVGPEGATIFVKLHQFERDDDTPVLKRTDDDGGWRPGLVDGLSVFPLHDFEGEHVALVKWAPNTVFSPHAHFGGEEIYVLDGTFIDEHGTYPAGSWLRSPHLSRHAPRAGPDGALIYVKVGHLHPDGIIGADAR
jgi:anti-sigma factor ChrR (cupin superfamily)